MSEALARRPESWRTDDEHNVYFEPLTQDSSPHAVREHTSKSAVAWDLIAADSPLRTAYEWDGLTTFLGQRWAWSRSSVTPTRSARRHSCFSTRVTNWAGISTVRRSR